MRKLITAFALVAVALVAAPLSAQETIEITEADLDRYMALVQADVLNERANLVGEAMEFTADESAKFWPLYTEYDRAVQEIGQQRWALIKDFAESYEMMTDDAAGNLIERSFEIRQKRMEMQREFAHKVATEMGPQIAARFVQVDNQIKNLLDLQIAMQLPLIQKPQ
jgi:hypothetical protein